MEAYEHLARLLRTEPNILKELEEAMIKKTGQTGILNHVLEENNKHITSTLRTLHADERTGGNIRKVLRDTMRRHEEQLLDYLKQEPGAGQFEKAALLARRITKTGKGFFLKKEYAREILRRRPPGNLLRYLKFNSVDEMFKKYDVTESFSALRFMESNEWMHETFEEAYSNFTAADFEEREIEIKVLGPEWRAVAEKFVAKKHHNVSHLKEFGVIFINPISENIPGKFVRDFALLLHYSHEIDFYSKLFRRNAGKSNFAEAFKALLRGDVLEINKTKGAEWLIIQRYLFKENPKDPRLLLPRVNPESMHWARGERDLANLGQNEDGLGLELWRDLDWVACLCVQHGEEVVSFDLEDNAMSLVSSWEGKDVFFTYHQREAMWTKIFVEYAGGEDKMEKLLIENFGKGIIRF